MSQMYDYMIKSYIMTFEIDDISINARLVLNQDQHYLIAIQDYGYFEVETLYYLMNRYNCEIFIYNTPPPSDYCPVINTLITKYDKMVKEGGLSK